jgi:hypothetical protein
LKNQLSRESHAEDHLCAVNALGGMIDYLYDADGTRIAKGTITSFSCNSANNGFQLTISYILGPNNEQLTGRAVINSQLTLILQTRSLHSAGSSTT